MPNNFGLPEATHRILSTSMFYPTRNIGEFVWHDGSVDSLPMTQEEYDERFSTIQRNGGKKPID